MKKTLAVLGLSVVGVGLMSCSSKSVVTKESLQMKRAPYTFTHEVPVRRGDTASTVQRKIADAVAKKACSFTQIRSVKGKRIADTTTHRYTCYTAENLGKIYQVRGLISYPVPAGVKLVYHTGLYHNTTYNLIDAQMFKGQYILGNPTGANPTNVIAYIKIDVKKEKNKWLVTFTCPIGFSTNDSPTLPILRLRAVAPVEDIKNDVYNMCYKFGKGLKRN